jgi:hypothetical protein
MSRSNEGRCCDAVLSILEGGQGGAREILSMDTPQSRGVEIRCRIRGTVYALEHTLVDPYPDKRRDDREFLGVMGELERSLSRSTGLRTDGSYHLYVESHAFRGRRRPQIPLIQEGIRAWVLANAHRLEPPAIGHTQELSAGPPSVPVRVRLQFTLWPGWGGLLLTGRMAPPDLPRERRERLSAALLKKGPKLHAEHTACARTVLILEDDDVALSNPIEIGAALHAELAKLNYSIEEVYLVDTKLLDRWQVWRMKQGANLWPTRLENPELWEFPPAQLNDLFAVTAK